MAIPTKASLVAALLGTVPSIEDVRVIIVKEINEAIKNKTPTFKFGLLTNNTDLTLLEGEIVTGGYTSFAREDVKDPLSDGTFLVLLLSITL